MFAEKAWPTKKPAGPASLELSRKPLGFRSLLGRWAGPSEKQTLFRYWRDRLEGLCFDPNVPIGLDLQKAPTFFSVLALVRSALRVLGGSVCSARRVHWAVMTIWGGPAGEVSPPQGKWRLLAFLGFSESCRQHKLQLGGLESIVALGQPACWF